MIAGIKAANIKREKSQKVAPKEPPVVNTAKPPVTAATIMMGTEISDQIVIQRYIQAMPPTLRM